jgi:hypothetical protein
MLIAYPSSFFVTQHVIFKCKIPAGIKYILILFITGAAKSESSSRTADLVLGQLPCRCQVSTDGKTTVLRWQNYLTF